MARSAVRFYGVGPLRLSALSLLRFGERIACLAAPISLRKRDCSGVSRAEGADAGVAGSRSQKAIAIARYLIAHPEIENEDGENLTDAIVEAVVRRALQSYAFGHPPEFHHDDFARRYEALQRALQRNGFAVETGRALPEALDVPAADDEVHALLDRYNFAVPRGHLD
jgi:hypothetical protein